MKLSSSIFNHRLSINKSYRKSHRFAFLNPNSRFSRNRRQGIATVWLALTLTAVLGSAAYVVDEGVWFKRQANLQAAADDAAVAGAWTLARSNNPSVSMPDAQAQAIYYAAVNGYTNGVDKVTVSVNSQTDPAKRLLTVQVSRVETSFFGKFFGRSQVNVSAKATAQYRNATSVLLSVTGNNYGINSGPINIGLYGPNQISARGDRFGVKYKSVGGVVKLNPDYKPGGYNFSAQIPSNWSGPAILQIYDADSYDSGIDTTAGNKRWDENGKDLYGLNSSGQPAYIGSNQETITRYTLWSDGGTPLDTTDDTAISYVDIGADQNKDKKWDNTFTFTPSTYRSGKSDVNFRLQAETISGCNENGFNLRVIAPGQTDAIFLPDAQGKIVGNGTSISAIGSMPVNFGVSGTGNVSLGVVPAGATNVSVDRFDCDTGVTPGDHVNYTGSEVDSNNNIKAGGTVTTKIGSPESAADDITENDSWTLDSSYKTSSWVAAYKAGASDNSTWSVTYQGPGVADQASVNLVE